MGHRGGGRAAARAGAGLLAIAAIAAAAVLETAARPARASLTGQAVTYADQGWTDLDRYGFYTTSQGSHLMPAAWFAALQRRDVAAPFAGDQLARYGYLRTDGTAGGGSLPVGFVIDGAGPAAQVGMTCAACHTGQVEWSEGTGAHALRLDGAPARADFQRFLLDLEAASQATRDDPARFDAFARAVLGATFSADAEARLRADFTAWVGQFSQFMDASLPAQGWGPGRLDAFGMIFNRVAARDIGEPANFAVADAPVSYPFLWNAHRQDHTQWNGAVPNGLFTTAIARNTGEVIGVFADFHPHQLFPGFVEFGDNSIAFANLQRLEEKIAVLRPPAWPAAAFGYDPALAAMGAKVFAAHCQSCHGEAVSPQVANGRAWVTPIVPGDTDPKMAQNAARVSRSGLFEHALKLGELSFSPFGPTTATVDILKTSVIGTLTHSAVTNPIGEDVGVWRALEMDGQSLSAVGAEATAAAALQQNLRNLYAPPPQADPRPAYEARVLYGIWATGPFLHNGSVPTLYDLLLAPARRPVTFLVGTRQFDPVKVGYRTGTDAPGNTVVFDTRLPGNSNAGHDYGASAMSETDRLALVEYLKGL